MVTWKVGECATSSEIDREAFLSAVKRTFVPATGMVLFTLKSNAFLVWSLGHTALEQLNDN